MAIYHYSILILANSPEERSQYCRYLTQNILCTYNLIELETGLAALRYLAQNQPDLILLDAQLPDVDGLEFLKQLELQFNTFQIPVIMLIEQEDETLAVQAIKAGASDYLLKDELTCVRFCHTVDCLLENNRLRQQLRMHEQQQQASERRFRAIFDNTFQFTGLLTTEGILLEVNQAALNFGGIRLEDVINRPFWETYWWTISPITQDKLKKAIARSAQGEFIRYEVDVLGAEGEIATIDFSLRPLKDESGQVVMLIPEGRNISDQKRIEGERQEAIDALTASEAELRGLFNAMVDVILVVDKQGRYLKIAPTGADKLYLPPEDLLGKTAHEVLPHNLAEQFVSIIQATLATQQPSECEYSLQIGNKEIWFHAKVSPISSETVIWAARDISETKHNEIIRTQAEKALQENQILLQVIMDSLPMAIFWKDSNSRFLGCNRKLILDAGLSSGAEIIGKTDFDLPWREEALLYQADDRIVIESGQPKFNIEETLTKSDQQTVWLRTNKMPLKNPDGEIFGVLGSYEDITERKKIEQALQESERRYATLAATAPVGIYHTDIQGNCLYVNQHWCEISGLTPEEAAGLGWLRGLHPQDRNLISTQWNRCIQSGENFCLEYRFRRPDGVEAWVFGQAVPEKNLDGRVIGYVGTITDISSRKQAEQERDRLLQILERQNSTLEAEIAQRTAQLQQSKERFRNLVETSSDWVWEVNEFGVYTYISPQIFNLLGYSPEEVLGKTPFDLMPPEEAQRVLGEFMKFISVQAPFECLENTNHHKDGRLITLETNGVPIFDADGKFCGYRGMDRDITPRKQAESALRQSETRFQRIATNLPGVMYQYILRPDGSHEFLYFSDRSRELFELESATIQQDANILFNLIHPEDFSSLQQSIINSAHSLQQWSWEGRLITPSGRLKWMQGISQPEQQANGDILWDGLILDISERKQTEITLNNLSDRLNLAINSGHIGIWDWDIVNDHLVWDERMYELYGVKASDCPSAYQAWEAGLHPDDLLSCRAASQQAVAGEKEYETEFRVIWPDGTIKFIKAYALVQRDEQGNAQRMIGINLDISEQQAALHERQLAEEAMRLSEERLLLALEASGDGLWDWNITTNELYLSPQWLGMLGFENGELPSHFSTWEKLVHPEDQAYMLVQLNVHLQDASVPYRLDYRVQTKAGDYRWIANYGKAVVRDEQGNALRMIGTHRDISAAKKAEAKLRQANEQLAISNRELARATRHKDEFLATMSHELRTPLNAILGLTEGLQDEVFGAINEKQRRSLQTIEFSGQHLLELINDILDLSKIEAGQMELHYAQIAITGLCQSSLAFIKQQAFQKRIQLELKIEPNLPDLLLDERRIRQVLINLLNNAVKFTPEGGQITLEITRQQIAPEAEITSLQDFIRIAVIDTGIGIASENLLKLFQPFIQIDSALNRQYAGTGLGLTLVKRIVEIHGGKVGVSSELGVGSCFTIDLPCSNIFESFTKPVNQVLPELNSTLNETVESSPLILLAEDNEDNIFTVSSYLEARGYRIILANNGKEAIALAQAELPNIILMDIQMPGMDGFEAIKQIRLNQNLVNIPIIALTALAMPGDHEKCLAVGANGYLSKPVKLKQLATIIQEFLAAAELKNLYGNPT
ncbi:PAS domain S-box protein [Nostoc sp. FACHB-152]|uniref:PAS domain S-box protein n=1 Tax=unclassified Nostoc TaxID=2593658 RepID=UPI0016844D79|nr:MULTISPECIES: PAS domain S-box protein [unclassified Nostoc]MBD2451443.1 PAS domain S-box protein [Nostoc sp. FACHB-152]MBD2472811.1 PAS domain S-box protein [Nostoc sp. FACHB-145]